MKPLRITFLCCFYFCKRNEKEKLHLWLHTQLHKISCWRLSVSLLVQAHLGVEDKQRATSLFLYAFLIKASANALSMECSKIICAMCGFLVSQRSSFPIQLWQCLSQRGYKLCSCFETTAALRAVEQSTPAVVSAALGSTAQRFLKQNKNDKTKHNWKERRFCCWMSSKQQQ